MVVVVVASGRTTVVTVVLLDELVVDDDVVDELVVELDDVVDAAAAVTVKPVVASCPLGLWAWMVAGPFSAQLVLAGAVHAAGIFTALEFDPLATAMVTAGRDPCSNLT